MYVCLVSRDFMLMNELLPGQRGKQNYLKMPANKVLIFKENEEKIEKDIVRIVCFPPIENLSLSLWMHFYKGLGKQREQTTHGSLRQGLYVVTRMQWWDCKLVLDDKFTIRTIICLKVQLICFTDFGMGIF